MMTTSRTELPARHSVSERDFGQSALVIARRRVAILRTNRLVGSGCSAARWVSGLLGVGLGAET